MDWKMVERFLTVGQAFVPVNENGKGDVTVLYVKDGTTEILDMRCEAFLSKLLSYFATSIAANRNRYGKLIGKKQLVPVVLSYGMTLVPYNVREPIGKQTRVGWVIAREILSFARKSPQETSIQLNHHDIPVQHSEKFCFEQLKNARCIEMCYGEIHEPHRKSWLFTAG
ncbi:MAG: hypothetical protein ACI35R_02970 [Bacillus sp. (in: firmicutes)]